MSNRGQRFVCSFSHRDKQDGKAPPDADANEQLVAKQRWLRDVLGLSFDPFESLDASTDTRLSQYMVKRDVFDRLYEDRTFFVFAPPGGGKTTSRVWLTRACRTQYMRRRVLSVFLTLPLAEDSTSPPSWAQYAVALSHSTAASLLFDLVYQPSCCSVRDFPTLSYRPSRFLDLDKATRAMLRSLLERDLTIPINYLLEQLENAGSLLPISTAFDPPLTSLPDEPGRESVRAFCSAVRHTSPVAWPYPTEAWEQTIALLMTILDYKSVYVLVDWADSHIQEPEIIVRFLAPLLEKASDWAQMRIFAKYFLPDSVRLALDKTLPITNEQCETIKWEPEDLVLVVQKRLGIASDGAFYSLSLISDADVNEDIELLMTRFLSPCVPREMLRLVQMVFCSHVKNFGPRDRLRYKDYQDAIEWYCSQRMG